MRVVVMQGNFGIFPTENLSLSMPAIQTCIGVYGEDKANKKLMCAHFDTEKQFNYNINQILTAFNKSGMSLSSANIKIFGGDGQLSRLRCTSPSTFIGTQIICAMRRAGFDNIEYTQHYSGLIAQTYNYEYFDGKSVVMSTFSVGSGPFQGIHPTVYQRALLRIQKRPDQYTAHDAMMVDISPYYFQGNR